MRYADDDAVQQAKQKCPNSKIFVGGYSQGGEVVHYAAKHGGNFAQDVTGAVSSGLQRDPCMTTTD